MALLALQKLIFLGIVSYVIASPSEETCQKYCFQYCSYYTGIARTDCYNAEVECHCLGYFSIKNPLVFGSFFVLLILLCLLLVRLFYWKKSKKQKAIQAKALGKKKEEVQVRMHKIPVHLEGWISQEQMKRNEDPQAPLEPMLPPTPQDDELALSVKRMSLSNSYLFLARPATSPAMDFISFQEKVAGIY